MSYHKEEVLKQAAAAIKAVMHETEEQDKLALIEELIELPNTHLGKHAEDFASKHLKLAREVNCREISGGKNARHHRESRHQGRQKCRGSRGIR